MADGERKTKIKKRNSRGRLNFFYLTVDGEPKLHRKLHINRVDDVVTTWSYPDHKRVGYTYTDVLKRYRPAFRTGQVCAMISRGRTQIEMAIVHGDVPRPQNGYNLETKENGHYWWSEEDVLKLHDYFSTVHRGRPRKDGLITPQSMPTKAELRALMRHEEIFYVKTDEGEFVPTWRANNF